MSRQAGGRPLRADARANREALLAAARRLYAERAGAVPFTLVAQEAGVGVATLYRNFPTQEDLVVGVLGQARDEVVAICQDVLAAMAEDPEAAWLQFAMRTADLQLGTFMPNLAAEVDLANLPAELLQAREDVFGAVTVVVEAAKDHSLVHPDVTPEDVWLGMGLLNRPLPAPLADTHSHIHPWLIRTFLKGLRP